MSASDQPRNPIAGREGNMEEIVRSLSDLELDEYARWVDHQIQNIGSRPETGSMYGSHGYARYRYTLWRGRIDRVRAERREAADREMAADRQPGE